MQFGSEFNPAFAVADTDQKFNSAMNPLSSIFTDLGTNEETTVSPFKSNPSFTHQKPNVLETVFPKPSGSGFVSVFGSPFIHPKLNGQEPAFPVQSAPSFSHQKPNEQTTVSPFQSTPSDSHQKPNELFGRSQSNPFSNHPKSVSPFQSVPSLDDAKPNEQQNVYPSQSAPSFTDQKPNEQKTVSPFQSTFSFAHQKPSGLETVSSFLQSAPSCNFSSCSLFPGSQPDPTAAWTGASTAAGGICCRFPSRPPSTFTSFHSFPSNQPAPTGNKMTAPGTGFNLPFTPSSTSTSIPSFPSSQPAPTAACTSNKIEWQGTPVCSHCGRGCGCRVADYHPTRNVDGFWLPSISAMPVYHDKSHEELRFDDHQQRGKTNSAFSVAPATASGSTTFGQPQWVLPVLALAIPVMPSGSSSAHVQFGTTTPAFAAAPTLIGPLYLDLSAFGKSPFIS